MKNTGYKILKLKSGETLVADVRENTKSHVSVFRPMEIKWMHLVDATGRKHETMVLVDWLKSTIETSFKIEKTFVLGVFIPRSEIIDYYEHQMIVEDTGSGRGSIPTPKIKGVSPNPGVSTNPLQNLLNDAMLIRGLIEKKNKQNESREFDQEEAEDFVEDIIDKLQHDKIVDEREDPSYGSNYCDWSSDPEDYLS